MFKLEKGYFFRQNSHGKANADGHIPVTEESWTAATKRMFIKCNLYKEGTDSTPSKGVTNHGIRKTACQWAGRCDGREIDTKNNGRWKDMTQMSKYHGQGMARRRQLTANGGQDPIWGIWVWKPTAEPDIDGRDQM